MSKYNNKIPFSSVQAKLMYEYLLSIEVSLDRFLEMPGYYIALNGIAVNQPNVNTKPLIEMVKKLYRND